MKVAFIGGGNMGEAMLAAMLAKGLAIAADITVSDISESRRAGLEAKYGVSALADNPGAVWGRDVVVLAVKPQNLAAVLAGLKGRLDPAQLVLSIVAGARIETLSRGLDHRRIVRAMPNTPAQIGEGITVWTSTPEVSREQLERAGAILGALGREIRVDDEGLLDMATAVSGSGPAYFFLMVECLIEAAREIGLGEGLAHELVVQTMLGAGHLIQKSGRPPAELRRMVTSPGGTTAEALLRLEQGGFADLIRQAVRAAYEKARKLGN